MKKLIVILASVFTLYGCEQQEEPLVRQADYIVVGRVPDAGTMAGPLIYYRIGSDIRVDSSVTALMVYAPQMSFTPLNNDTLYEQVKRLLYTVPGKIMPRHNQHIGRSTTDMGYLDVIVYVNQHPHRFYFEEDQSASGPVVQDYVALLNKYF